MGNVLGEFVDILVGGISKMATGIGEGVNTFVGDLFFRMGTDGTVEGLSTFGGTVAIFAGISLACGLTALIFNWVRSIGNR